jgi:hypothetical protein
MVDFFHPEPAKMTIEPGCGFCVTRSAETCGFFAIAHWANGFDSDAPVRDPEPQERARPLTMIHHSVVYFDTTNARGPILRGGGGLRPHQERAQAMLIWRRRERRRATIVDGVHNVRTVAFERT